MPSTHTLQDFVRKWKRAEARERQSVQEHFIDLCALVCHETPMHWTNPETASTQGPYKLWKQQ